MWHYWTCGRGVPLLCAPCRGVALPAHSYGRTRQSEEHQLKCSVTGSYKFWVCPLLLWWLMITCQLAALGGGAQIEHYFWCVCMGISGWAQYLNLWLTKADHPPPCGCMTSNLLRHWGEQRAEKREVTPFISCQLELGHPILFSPALGLNYSASSSGFLACRWRIPGLLSIHNQVS